jgi:outer membrane protein assembly factor BamB
MVVVASSDGEVFAYNHAASHTGAPPPLLWKQSLGPSRYHITIPAGFTRSPLSNIPRPVGVTSTPVIDSASRRLFVVACHQEASGGASYTIYALEIDTGTILQSAKLVDPGGPGHITFDAHGLDQRGGLNIIAGRIYVAFSDLYAFDAEDLPHPSGGWIVSCKANDLRHQRYFSVTRTVHGGGIWAPGGVSADDSNRLYAATGTGLSGVSDAYWSDLTSHHQHPGDRGDFFMSVVQLAYDGDKLRLDGWYQPGHTGGTGHDIEVIEKGDNDLGSCSVLVLPTIGGRRLVMTSSKDGDAYLLDADKKLGLYDGHVDRVTIFPNEGVGAPALWRRKNGEHVVFLSGRQSLAALKLAPHFAGGGHWIQPLYAGGFFSDIRFSTGNWAGSPVVARDSGPADSAHVWVAEPRSDHATTDGVVYAIDAATGKVVFDSTHAASNSVGSMPHFPGLSAAGNFVFVANNHGFVCYEFKP